MCRIAASCRLQNQRESTLPQWQLYFAVLVTVLAHGIAGWAVLNNQAMPPDIRQAAPMFFAVMPIDTEALAPHPPAVTKSINKPAAAIQPAPVITASASASAAALDVEPVVSTAPVGPEQLIVAEPGPAVAPPPKIIPASAIQYLVPPQMEYPRASRPFREAGRVSVRVYVDTAGLPAIVQVNQSSGFSRLDTAAENAVRKARFKPYMENGEALAGWAVIPLNFELER